MKKIIIIFITLFILCSCSSEQTSSANQSIKHPYDKPNAIDFYELKNEIYEKRNTIYCTDIQSERLENYVSQFEDDDFVLTNEQLNTIQNAEQKRLEILNKEQMIEDTELLFAMLHYSYGAYYYFGGDEVFNAVKEEIISNLDNSTTSTKFASLLIKKLSPIIIDSCFSIGENANGYLINQTTQPTYYYSDLYFNKDENGNYYLTSNDEKWYYVESDDELRIVPTLLEDGQIYYNLMSYSNNEPTNSITLSYSSNERQEKISWTTATLLDYVNHDKSENTNDYYMINTAGENVYNYFNNYKDFSLAKNIIIDNRSNDGNYINGDNSNGNINSIEYDWFINVLGKSSNYRFYSIENENALFNNLSLGNEKTTTIENNGWLIESTDKNIFSLMDTNTSSNLNNIIYSFRTSADTICIGTKTISGNIGGNLKSFYLPNSGLKIKFGNSLILNEDVENYDARGIEPDLWCDPSYALTATINLCKRINETYVEGSNNNKKEISNLCTINFDNIIIYPDGHFGRIVERSLEVSYNYQQISDFTVTSDSPSLVAKNVDGLLYLKCSASGIYPITISCNGEEFTFYVHRDA